MINTFLIAVKYRNNSVLENHHFNTTLRIINTPQCNILEHMVEEQKNFLFEVMKASILATDMRRHTELVELMASAPWKHSPLSSSVYEIESNESKILLCTCILHSADLSNPVKIFTVAEKWGEKLSVELNNEVKLQRELGLPVMQWMETSNKDTLYKREHGFCLGVALPMWVILADLYPVCEQLVIQLQTNIASYNSKS